MKALTLTQPYAFLVSDRIKRYETRSWGTNYRGPLAIHAAATLKGVGGRAGFVEILENLPLEIAARLTFWFGERATRIEMGAVVAVSWLVDVEKITAELRRDMDADELAVGNFADGRYAWKLREPIPIAPVPIRGWQGLWDIDDDLLPEYARKAIRHPGEDGA